MSHIIAFDTITATESSRLDFDEQPELLVFKSALVNTLEAFVSEYASNIMAIVQECEEVRARRRAGKIIMDVQSGLQLVGRAQSRLDAAYYEISRWDGEKPLTILLPYAHIETATTKDGVEHIDTTTSKAYVNGMFFQATY
jgi:cytosine/adenosine deaminase-related metal-dependent hydrolase